jgi:uncharacterized protein (TIGR03083 family)
VDDDDLLAALVRDAARVADAVRSAGDGGLGAPVPWCGDWVARDVVGHLGGVHRWALAATHTPPGAAAPRVDAPAPRPTDDLAGWLVAGAHELVERLRAVGPDAPCWALSEPALTGSWIRRQAHETSLHRWDVEEALGGATPIEEALAADGVDEVLDVMAPRQVRLGRSAGPVGGMELSHDSGSRRVGSGPTRVVVRASAPDLLLVLWGRRPRREPVVEGDPQVWRSFLGGAPTP